MKQCPYCLGQIPDAAAKCQHCGEWVEQRPASNDELGLGEAANRYINYKIVTGVLSLIVFLIFFLLFWLPNFIRMQNGPPFGGPPPTFQLNHPQPLRGRINDEEI